MWYYVLKNTNAADVEDLQNIYPWHYFLQQGSDTIIQPELKKAPGEYIEQEIEGGTFYYLPLSREQYLIPVDNGDQKIETGIFNIIPHKQPFKKFVFGIHQKPKKKRHPYLWDLYRQKCDDIIKSTTGIFPEDDIASVLCSLALANSYKITPEITDILDLSLQEIGNICSAGLGISHEEVKKK